MPVRVIPVGPLQTNCYLLSCPENGQTAVIDPGWSGAELYEEIGRAGLTVAAIMLTHAHFDHLAGVAELKRLSAAPVMAHPDSWPMMRQAQMHARAWGFEIEPVPEIDAELAEDQSLAVGTLELSVLSTPGHAPGHVSLYLASGPAVFDGDVLFRGSIGRTDLPGGNYETLIRSIRDKLLRLPDETTVYSGHGPATSIGHERRWNPFLQNR